MALSSEILSALAKEHARLSAEQLRITQELHEIEALLRRHGRKVGSKPEMPRPPARAAVVFASGAAQTSESPSLKHAILQIMDNATRGFRPSEVTKLLTRAGFADTGASTPFAYRVASEMARLFRAGRLTKDSGDGRYRSQVHSNGHGDGEPSALDLLTGKQ
jgi:hypothetical protein